jgi:preprotein translocase subunit SecD
LESTQWLKLGVILAMVLGSLYVLMPTVVTIVEGPQVMLAREASDVKSPHKKHGPDTRVQFEVADPSRGEEVGLALETRLDAARIPIEKVHMVGDKLEVVLAPGGRREKVEAAAKGGGQAAFATFASVFPTVGAAQPTADDLAKQAGLPLPPSAVAFDARIEGLEARGGALHASILPPAVVATPEKLVVTIDGVARAVASVDAASPDAWDYSIAPLVPGGADAAAAVGALQSDLAGPLPTELTPIELDKDPVQAATPETAPAEPSVFPAWFVAMLPPTPMQLGLDLQGGIDLTLQVELDETLLSQANRDGQFVKDQAARDGLAITEVHRDNVEPILDVHGTAPLGDVQSWMAKKLPTYEYVGTKQVDGADVHSFRMRDTEQKRVQDSATDQVLETLRKRIDATGVKEPSIVKKGTGRINVQLPGMVDLQQAIDAIGTTAVLEFRLVDEEFDESKLEPMLAAARQALPEDQYLDDDILNRWLHDSHRLDAKNLLLWLYKDTPEGDHVRTSVVPLHEEVMLTGNDVNSAGVAWDQNQQPYVRLEFKSRGSQIFCSTTTENVGKRFAIILDNELKSTPVIRDKICGGSASIEMGSSMDALDEANNLALVLRTGSLNAPVTVGEVRTVGATLGKDAIRHGAIGTMIGSALVFLYMLLWYRLSGFVANIALAINVVMVMAILSMFGATLTLPGICGLALTVGMAVDANIIVYERIREEMKLGMNARKAVDVGFERAFSAIMDANVAHAIAGVVLYSYGTGPIKGFAVTLLIGIITTMITALFVTKTLMEVLTRNSTTRLSI